MTETTDQNAGAPQAGGQSGLDAASPVRRMDFRSEDVRKRTQKRYRAERRFKMIGAGAIVLAGLFLVLLFWNILSTGLPAFTQHSIDAEIIVTADVVDPSGKRNKDDIRRGDYFALARNYVRNLFPEVTARRDRIMLSRLLSTGAVDALRARVIADPSLIGKSVKTQLLLSDDADIYFKGGATKIIATTGRGEATPTGTTGDIALSTSANDFAVALKDIKRRLNERARSLRSQADAIERRSRGGEQPAQIRQLRDEANALQARFEAPDAAEPLSFDLPSILVAINGGLIKVNKLNNAQIEGSILRPLTSGVAANPGAWRILTLPTPESGRKISDKEVVWLETLRDKGQIQRHFNWRFFTAGDSREPELAGIRGAVTGSILMLLATLVLCLPIGVLAAIYLEEFAPKNWLTEVIEVNINNLAAVPSIVFGLLGLAVFLNFFGMPRSAPIVGGFVLALMTLPTIIIASRAAIKAVPPSIREGALGVGASHQQAVFHHVLPLAMPGIMTGTIVGMAQALGETAPLLMIGMVAFIVDIPSGFADPATVLPVQIFLWSDLPEIAFQAKTAAAIIVLMAFLFLMNGTAILLRKRFERRW